MSASLLKLKNKVEMHLIEKLTTQPLKGESKYMNSELKTWKEHIKTCFHVQNIRHVLQCNSSVKERYTNKIKTNIFRYILKKKNDAETQQCSMFIHSNDDHGFLRSKRRHEQVRRIFNILLKLRVIRNKFTRGSC